MRDITFEQVDKMRIHELRDYAKDLKITSPTTLKKEDLVAKIKEKLTEEQGLTASLRQSIESVVETSIMDILTIEDIDLYNTLIEKKFQEDKAEEEEDRFGGYFAEENFDTTDHTNDEDYVYPAISQDRLVFSVAQNEAYYDVDSIDIQGYVDIHPMGYGIIKDVLTFKVKADNIYIPKIFIEDYNLHVGDFIKGYYKHFAREDVNILTELTSVDGKLDVENLVRFDEVVSDDSYQKIKCNILKNDLVTGKRFYIESMSEANVANMIDELLQNNSINVKLFNIKTEYNYHKQKQEMLDIIDIKVGDDDVEGLDTISFALERAKREFENGNSNVIIINGFNELLKIMNIASTGYLDYSKFSGVALNQMLRVMSIAKQYHNVGIALICVDRNGVCDGYKNIFENEFGRMFNFQK